MEQVIFIVWRESVEAMLVIGILYAWLKANPDAKNGMKYLWGGVGAGLGLATILGASILIFQDFFAGDAQEYFQMGMVLVAAVLIVQMVVWMRKHGRTLKRELEAGMAQNAETANWWGMLTLVAIAVAREGSETVIFLYGMGLAQEGTNMVTFALSALGGFVLALVSFGILQAGSKVFSWRAFFRFSETLLLLLAASLLVTGVEKMQAFEWLPTLVDPIWDSSAVLADTEGVGSFLAGLTGYRAQPSLMLVLLYAAYWGVVWLFLKQASGKPMTGKTVVNAQAAAEGKA